MRDLKERVLSCLMAIVLCMTPPVVFLAQAEKEDITMRLEVEEGEERRAVFSGSKEDLITARAGSRQQICGVNVHGEPVAVIEVEMYTAEGERFDEKGEIREGKYYFEAPDKDVIIHVKLEEPEEPEELEEPVEPEESEEPKAEYGKRESEDASGPGIYREIDNGFEGYGCFDYGSVFVS